MSPQEELEKIAEYFANRIIVNNRLDQTNPEDALMVREQITALVSEAIEKSLMTCILAGIDEVKRMMEEKWPSPPPTSRYYDSGSPPEGV